MPQRPVIEVLIYRYIVLFNKPFPIWCGFEQWTRLSRKLIWISCEPYGLKNKNNGGRNEGDKTYIHKGQLRRRASPVPSFMVVERLEHDSDSHVVPKSYQIQDLLKSDNNVPAWTKSHQNVSCMEGQKQDVLITAVPKSSSTAEPSCET